MVHFVLCGVLCGYGDRSLIGLCDLDWSIDRSQASFKDLTGAIKQLEKALFLNIYDTLLLAPDDTGVTVLIRTLEVIELEDRSKRMRPRPPARCSAVPLHSG